jgi:hypothetical protein
VKDFIRVKADTIRHGWEPENQDGGRHTRYTYNSAIGYIKKDDVERSGMQD